MRLRYDAPALATADIGIAIGSGSEVTKETAGIILIRNGIRDLLAAIRLSCTLMTKIKQNLLWVFTYNTIGVRPRRWDCSIRSSPLERCR